MSSSRFGIACVIALVTGAACTDLDSATNLNPEGPPMIRQVRLSEMYRDASGNLNERIGPVFAFGNHPQVTTEDQAHPVTSAKAVSNKLRIIMDELLVGNYLEQIACRGPVKMDAVGMLSAYDNVPVGATPDDIARCSVAKDALPASCPSTNQYSVCICQIDTGCGDVTNPIDKGKPVGVLDVNQDGAADDTRMMPGSVGLKCGTVEVPIDINQSYWNPSGDQNVPAMGGFDALGPAIVLVPGVLPGASMGTPQFLPTNTTCNLHFDATVVDKQQNQVCAPPEGDITKSCTPGDVAQFSFKVEPLAVKSSPIQNGDTGVARTGFIDVVLSAPPDPASLSAITMTEGTTPFTGFTVSLPFPTTLRITWSGTGLAANTMYTITFGTGLTDLYKQPAPMPVSFTFTTGA
jgi:hypothetical protein